jgi:hypothetical protein
VLLLVCTTLRSVPACDTISLNPLSIVLIASRADECNKFK